jgi:hypothetical protein
VGVKFWIATAMKIHVVVFWVVDTIFRDGGSMALRTVGILPESLHYHSPESGDINEGSICCCRILFSPYHHVQTSSGAQVTTNPVGTGFTFPAVKRPEREAENPHHEDISYV